MNKEWKNLTTNWLTTTGTINLQVKSWHFLTLTLLIWKRFDTMYQFNYENFHKWRKPIYLFPILSFSIEPTTPEERSLQQKEWLKNNSEPFSQVQLYMKDTVLYRANWIRANNSKDVLEILTEYPHLISLGMVWDHWNMLHTLCIPYLHFKRECPVFVFVFCFSDCTGLPGDAWRGFAKIMWNVAAWICREGPAFSQKGQKAAFICWWQHDTR